MIENQYCTCNVTKKLLLLFPMGLKSDQSIDIFDSSPYVLI